MIRRGPLVSAIVLKLLSKNPDHRYQTADGVAFDLERAATQWGETGSVESFDLGTRDWEDRIRKPSRLFGRENESAELEQRFVAACGGAVVLSVVIGLSGVGKSALVQSLRQTVRKKKGIFAPGKFDLLQRSTPYSALSQALRSVVRRRLADPAEELLRWKQEWQEAVGSNGRILVDLIPELVHFFGEPKPLIEVGPIEAKNRFQRTIQRFVQVIATAEHPLLLFLDDLQWADPASLVLLEELVTDPMAGHLFLVGAYRNDEVGPSHPLNALLEALKGKGLPTHTITLAPLGDEVLSALVADLLGRPMVEVSALSHVVKEKTDGSPFFVSQFLQTLHEQKLLSRDVDTGRWQWQREAIERARITDNVVTLLTQRLAELPSSPLDVLQTAACIGNQFELGLLAYLVGRTSSELFAALADAVREGLLVPEDDTGDIEKEVYAFVHDRVQQAAYEARPLDKRIEAHRDIGRQLRQRYGTACADEELFTTLYHRNRAMDLLTSAEEKRDLCAQNLRAGQRAKTSGAYAEAVEFLRIGQQLLGEAGWTEDPALTFETYLGLAEVMTLSLGYEAGEPMFRQCIERAPDAFGRARVVNVWLPLLMVTGQFALGVELGLAALDWLGRPLPRASEEHEALIAGLLAEVEPILARMTVEAWRAMPASADRVDGVVCEILDNLSPLAIFVQPSLGPCCSLSIVAETLRHGLMKTSLSGCAVAATFLLIVRGNFSSASRLMDATVALVERSDIARTNALCMTAMASLYTSSRTQVKDLFLRAERVGTEEGNITFVDVSPIERSYVDALSGAYLPGIAQSLDAKKSRDVFTRSIQSALTASIDVLWRSPAVSEEADTALRALEALVERDWKSPFLAFFGRAMASWTGLHLGLDRWALQTALRTEPLWIVSWGNPPLIAFAVALCIALVQPAHRV